jgi:hypothetical protein
LPTASPSLNKLCAFDPPGLRDDDYLLYLDADIFVADDPLPLLTKHAARADIVCGRPWNTFEGMQDFFEFVALPTAFDDDRSPLLESYAGGLTFYGLCNSGMYFMPSAVAVAMKYGALAYLLKAQTDPHYRDRDPYAPSNFGIDSIVLWAAQYSLNFTVDIAPTALNFMAPVEKYMPRFLRLDADEAAAEEERQGRALLKRQNRASRVIVRELRAFIKYKKDMEALKGGKKGGKGAAKGGKGKKK